jgi:hypothetical protein
MTIAKPPAFPEIDYPETDGNPMAESDFQRPYVIYQPIASSAMRKPLPKTIASRLNYGNWGLILIACRDFWWCWRKLLWERWSGPLNPPILGDFEIIAIVQTVELGLYRCRTRAR